MKKNKVDKNSPEFWLRQVNTGRHTLIVVMIITLVNMLLVLVEAPIYFLFSASVPYYLTVFGYVWDLEAFGSVGVFTIIAVLVSMAILVVYLLCWINGKKKIGWLTTALVLFSVDTLCLVALAIWAEDASCVKDLIFHALVLAYLGQAISSDKKLKEWNANQRMYQNAYPAPGACQQVPQAPYPQPWQTPNQMPPSQQPYQPPYNGPEL